MRFYHSGHCAWDARRLRPDHALARELTIGADVHVARRGERCRLPIVESIDATVGHSDHHVPAAAQITGFGERDREGKSGGHGGVDGIATLLHHLRANLRGESIVAGYYRVRSKRRVVAGREAPPGRENGWDALWYRGIVRRPTRRRCRKKPRRCGNGCRGYDRCPSQDESPSDTGSEFYAACTDSVTICRSFVHRIPFAATPEVR